jgi:thioesterase-3
MINELELEVSAAEIDGLGHVNNARFLEYLERGRVGWYNQCGLFDEASPDPRLGTVVVNINVNFRLECFQGERLRVITRPRSKGKKSYLIYQEIRNANDRLVADAEVSSVVMDLDTRQTVAIPEILARHFDRPISARVKRTN